jgi:hypothetical protein
MQHFWKGDEKPSWYIKLVVGAYSKNTIIMEA